MGLMNRFSRRAQSRLGANASCAAVAALLVAVGLPSLAHAQQAGAEAESDATPGEIVVTAQKRAQRANDIGLTINAVGGDTLQSKGITDVSALNQVASGFSVGASSGGFPVFSIRGINFNANQLSASPTVSAYTDETPLPYATMWGGLLLDVDHVEVLKGPQGTLFGQNATGGAINAVAAKPTSTAHAGANMSLNKWGGFEAQAYLSGPISDTVGARLAVATQQGGAWQKDFVNTNEKYGGKNTMSVVRTFGAGLGLN